MNRSYRRYGSIRNICILPMILLTVVIVLGSSSLAQDPSDSPETTPASFKLEPPDNLPPESAAAGSNSPHYAKMADDFHRSVSKKLITSAIWLDSFFQNERSEIEENSTSLRLRLSTFLEEGESPKADTELRLRLVLPELEDRFHILITGDKDENRDFEDEPENRSAEIDENAGKNVNLSLRYFIRMARDNNISLHLGARVNEFPPVFYGGPRFRFSRQIKTWQARFVQEINYYTDDGWETETDVDFERALTKRLIFRNSLEGNWYEHEIGYYYEVHFILYQIVTEDQAFKYAWNNYFQTRPHNRLNQTILSIQFRQRIWRPWFYFELQPQLAFRHEDDYEPSPGITFAVEVFFGGRRW